MNEELVLAPFVSTILHPTDFSETSDAAFAHALAITLIRKARLTLLHAERGSSQHHWSEFPSIRAALERWGLLEPGSPRSAVYKQLQIRVEKLHIPTDDAVDAILEMVEEDQPDLLVLGTEGREGLPRWSSPSVAERAARRSRTTTLFVPSNTRGFVSAKDGSTQLRRILLPVDVEPDPEAAILRATRAAAALGDVPVEISILHVGGEAPVLPDLPSDPDWTWKHLRREGDAVEEILAVAEEEDSDLIVMATAGHEGVLDALRGSVTERVLRGARCPLLAIPE